jgi:hypothetical protein
LAIIRGVKHNCHFLPFFFQALVFSAGSEIGQNFGSARSANTHVSSQKKIWDRISNIDNNPWGSWGGGNPVFFPPPTNPNRDFVPVYARRIKIIPKKENAGKKKRKCGKVIFYVFEPS